MKAIPSAVFSISIKRWEVHIFLLSGGVSAFC